MIKIRFSSGRGIYSSIIRWSTWSWCSHVGIMLSDIHVIDATGEQGVAIRTPYGDKEARYFTVELPEEKEQKLLVWIKSQIGKGYDWSAIYGMAFRKDWHNDDKWFCSELVAAAFEEAGHPLLRSENLSRVTPRDLLMSPYLRAA